MVGVIVNRPVGENNVRPFGFEEAMEFLVMGGIYNRGAINLSGKSGKGFEDLQAFLALAPIKVEQNNLVIQVGVAGDGAATSGFRVAGMPSRDDHFEFRPDPLRRAKVRLLLKPAASRRPP